METRAKHITIGAFVLSSVLAITFFVFWLARFEGEVILLLCPLLRLGLQLRIDSTVLFGGIPVGGLPTFGSTRRTANGACRSGGRAGTRIRVDSRPRSSSRASPAA